METYTTSQIARIIGIHPNTVRFYEELQLIPAPRRLPNGYRVFTDLHVEQFRLARTALKVEVLQNGLRKRSIEIIKTSAAGDFDEAIRQTDLYLQQLTEEQNHAEEAITIVTQILEGNSSAENGQEASHILLTRKEAADTLQVTIDTLRNWELNGLLTVKRRQNGYRVYSSADMERLKIIRVLRCANYSLSAILRMLNALSEDSSANIRELIDTPAENDDIISVYDKLITSLTAARVNGESLRAQLSAMKDRFS